MTPGRIDHYLKRLNFYGKREQNIKLIIIEHGNSFRCVELKRERWARWFHISPEHQLTEVHPNIVESYDEWPVNTPLGVEPMMQELTDVSHALPNDRKAIGLFKITLKRRSYPVRDCSSSLSVIRGGGRFYKGGNMSIPSCFTSKSKEECGNHSSISLMAHIGNILLKIFVRVWISCPKNKVVPNRTAQLPTSWLWSFKYSSYCTRNKSRCPCPQSVRLRRQNTPMGSTLPLPLNTADDLGHDGEEKRRDAFKESVKKTMTRRAVARRTATARLTRHLSASKIRKRGDEAEKRQSGVWCLDQTCGVCRGKGNAAGICANVVLAFA